MTSRCSPMDVAEAHFHEMRRPNGGHTADEAGLVPPLVHFSALEHQGLIAHDCSLRYAFSYQLTPARTAMRNCPCSVELCGASAAVNDVKRPWPFGQQRGGFP